jgi:hypothetical protein
MQIFGSVLTRDFPKLTSLSFSLRPSLLRHVMYTIVDRYYMTMKERLAMGSASRMTLPNTASRHSIVLWYYYHTVFMSEIPSLLVSK